MQKPKQKPRDAVAFAVTKLAAGSGTRGPDFRARKCNLLPFAPMTAASTSWRSAEGVIQAICDFVLNDEYSAIEVILDCSILLLALRFEGGFQVSDFYFKGVNLNLPLGYPGSCSILFCICRYMGRPTGQVVEVKRPHKERITSGGGLLSDYVWRVARIPTAGTSI